MTPDERRGFEIGVHSVLAELWNVIATLESSCNLDSSYGKGQRYILGRVVKEMGLKEEDGQWLKREGEA